MATMTETVTVPYSPKVFHGLEDHFEASEKLEHVNGVEWMREVGKALLEKHNLEWVPSSSASHSTFMLTVT